MKREKVSPKKRTVAAAGENASPRIRPTTKIPAAAAFGILLAFGVVAILVADAIRPLPPVESAAASTSGSSPESPQAAAWKRMIDQHFAGDAACASCHPKQAAAQRRSGHSRTAVAMSDSDFATELLAGQPYPDSRRPQTFEFTSHSNRFMVRDVDDPGLPALPATWLLGSGTHAQTPIFVDQQAQRGVEMRWSFLANRDGIGLTPEHEKFDQYEAKSLQCYGRPMDAGDVRSCLGCHTTVGPPAQLPIQNDLYVANVGCERCHGPRKQHALLAHQGRGEESKPLVQYASAEAYIDACAQCHRDESSVSPTAQPHELVRFQPYGLKRSRCYLESPDKLTCSTCHDPHDTVSHDRTVYIQQCQQCHQSGHDSLCTANPQGDCIDCHMPATEWTAGIAFHDHEIRIHEALAPKHSTPQVKP
ncbi:multiheme c-type cytochrome [Rosistilla oblonga]|nr:multiheme c-type cytochrome [Rosistilla oblonga]